jgi:hypothetical protein
MSLERRQRADLVCADQPTAADNVGRQDSGKPALNRRVLGHARRPPID